MTANASLLPECELLLDDSPLRQGHVFQWLAPSADPWTQYGLTVTADCDFVRGKHHDLISYVPVIRLRDYVRLFVLPEFSEKALRNRFEEAIALIRSLQAELRPEFSSPVSDAGAQAWIERESPDGIAEALSAENTQKGARLVSLVTDIQRVRMAFAVPLFEDQVLALNSLKRGTEKRAELQIREKLKSLPGDCFFLGNLGLETDCGFVAYLRLVRDVHASAIAIRTAELRDADVRAKRIARLRAPYVFRLTQQLGAVFADIALPEEYEEARDRIIKSEFQEATSQSVGPKG